MAQVKIIVAGAEAMIDEDQLKFHEKKLVMLREARVMKDEMSAMQNAGMPTSAQRIAIDKHLNKIQALNKKMTSIKFI